MNYNNKIWKENDAGTKTDSDAEVRGINQQ